MTERQLKYSSGLFLIGVHIIILFLIVILFFVHGFNASEFTTLFGVIMPMFSGYTTAIIGFLIKDRYVGADTTRGVTFAYTMLLFLLPSILASIIAASIWFQAHSTMNLRPL